MSPKKLVLILGLLLVLTLFAGMGSADDGNKVNLNTATVEELTKVPGLNPELAGKLIERRKQNGEFVDMEELLDIEGIDSNLLRGLKQHVVIKSAAGCNC